METSLYPGQYSLWKNIPRVNSQIAVELVYQKLECAKVYTRHMEDAMVQKVQVVPKIPKTASSINHGGCFLLFIQEIKLLHLQKTVLSHMPQ